MPVGWCQPCGATKPVVRSRRFDIVLCKWHLRKFFYCEPCVYCRRSLPVVARTADGKAVCGADHNKRRNVAPCSRCRAQRPLRYWWRRKRICRQCRHQVKPSPDGPDTYANCTYCEKYRVVNRRVKGEPYCCGCACRLFKQGTCQVCHQKKRVRYRVGKKRACQLCHKNSKPVALRNCLNCGQSKPVKAKGFCSACYRAYLKAKNAA